MFLLLENPAKNTNLGPILRCASAFGIRHVVTVGYSQCSVAGSHGASKHLDIVAWPTASQAVRYLREMCGCQLIVGSLGCVPDGFSADGYQVLCHNDGIVRVTTNHDDKATDESIGLSLPVHVGKFSGTVCLAINRLGEGLSRDLGVHCDSFVHVPHEQAGVAPVGLLDTPSTMSIVLNYVCDQLKMNERIYEGHKFQVAERKAGPDLADEAFRRERQLRRQQQVQEEVDEDSGAALFGPDQGDY